MRQISIDQFEDVGKWTAFSSGGPELLISKDQGINGKAMRLDFDFKGFGGFLVAGRKLQVDIPEAYEIRLKMKGSAPPNIFEFKLIDSSNRNVWRYRSEDFVFPTLWQEVTISDREISFAWGPLGGGAPCDIAAIEIVIAARSGGRGTVWVDELSIVDRTYRGKPSLEASSALPDHGPQLILDPMNEVGWRSHAEDTSQWIIMDFQEEREYGGVVIHWEKGLEARAFDVAISSDSKTWKKVFHTSMGTDEKTYIYLPDTRSRFILLDLKECQAGRGFGIKSMEVKACDFSRSINGFFQNVASDQRPGLYPKYFLGRQSYWTVIGRGSRQGPSLINEEGLLEPGGAAFSVVPFIFLKEQLITWADVSLDQELEDGFLPIPIINWKTKAIGLVIKAYAGGEGESGVTASYFVTNLSSEKISVVLFLAILPFQVTPHWQKWRSFGGATKIREITCDGHIVLVNRKAALKSLTPHNGFGTATFGEGGIARYIKSGLIPDRSHVIDEFGYASGALRFELDLEPGESHEVCLAAGLPAGIPVESQGSEEVWGSHASQKLHEKELSLWHETLDRQTFLLPAGEEVLISAVKTCAAHILINRRGPALCPGPRRYSRAWIRDGVVMGTALIRMGLPGPLKDFLSWYGSFQAQDGQIPDCADDEGSEWLPEYDAYGQFIHGIAEYFRFTRDDQFLKSIWPKAQKALHYMEGLRAMRTKSEFTAPDKRAFYGILPESMSHEGYMANPVHSYWDDFWALRGLKDVSLLAETLGETEEALRTGELAEVFRRDLKASIEKTIAEKGIEYLPGSVELADFDPAASSLGITLLPGWELLPHHAAQRTFEIYLEGLRKRSAGLTDWNNYSAYEIRIIGALVMLGMRDEAMEVTRCMLGDRRITAWNQWPEISWRSPEAPAFLGDLPHTWISAEFINAVRCMFAYERVLDDSLVLAEGLPYGWISEAKEVGISGFPTYYGNLSYSIIKEGPAKMRIYVSGDLMPPPGGIIIKPPILGPISSLTIDGESQSPTSEHAVICHRCPADIVLTC